MTLLYIIIPTLICVSFSVMLFKHHLGHNTKLTFGKIFPFVAFICAMFVFYINNLYNVKTNIKLHEIAKSIEYGRESYKVFKKDLERKETIDSLRSIESKLLSIEKQRRWIDLFVGYNSETDAYLDSAIHLVNVQLKRLSYLNHLSNDSVLIMSEEIAEDIAVVGHNINISNNLDFAIRCNNSALLNDSTKIVVLIQDKDSIIYYSQAYTPKLGINSFVLPVRDTTSCTIKAGYLQYKNHRFHRIKYKL